jgi:hypothetical protein
MTRHDKKPAVLNPEYQPIKSIPRGKERIDLHPKIHASLAI